jgi:hypothetical protein
VDGNRFERLSRALGAERTRRCMLRTFAGGLAVAIFGTVAAAEPSHAGPRERAACQAQASRCHDNCAAVAHQQGCSDRCNAELRTCLRSCIFGAC